MKKPVTSMLLHLLIRWWILYSLSAINCWIQISSSSIPGKKDTSTGPSKGFFMRHLINMRANGARARSGQNNSLLVTYKICNFKLLLLLYTVCHGSQYWSRESNTIWVKTSLHLNTFNKFQIRFKTRFMTKTQCRDNLSPVLATSPCPELFIPNAFFVVLSRLFIIKHKQMFVLKT